MSFKRKYLWVSEDFHKHIVDEVKKIHNAGFNIGSAGITHKLTPILKDNVKVENLFPEIVWREKKRK